MYLEEFRARMKEPRECSNGDTLNNTSGKHYFKIWDFMVFDFQLEKTQLFIYAIIFGIYHSKKLAFEGSKEYLIKWTSSCKRSVDAALKSLVDKKLILKKKRKSNGVVRNVYGINPYMLPVCELFERENKNTERLACVNEKRLKSGQPPVDPLDYTFYMDTYGRDFDAADDYDY